MPDRSNRPHHRAHPAKNPPSSSSGHRPSRPKTKPSRREHRPSLLRVVHLAWIAGGHCLRIASIGAILFGVIAAVYLTVRTSSSTRTIPWLPDWVHPISVWMDHHGYLQNIPAYALLALPFMTLFRGSRARAQIVGTLALFATVLEAIQYFIPSRFCEWQDVALSWVGLLITWGSFEAFALSTKRLRQFLAASAQEYKMLNR